MKESLGPLQDVFDVWDFMFFGADLEEDVDPTDEEYRRAAENALAHLDMMQAANFPFWEMEVDDNPYARVSAETGIARWREQLSHALETGDWDNFLEECIESGPRVVVFAECHPLHPSHIPPKKRAG